MSTVRDLITLQLKDAGIVGVGQTPLEEDMNDAFIRLNQMIGQWATKKFFMWHLNEYSLTSTGATQYTVGPGMDFDTNSIPNVLDSAFLRQTIPTNPNQVDWTLTVLYAIEDYNRIALKQLTSFTRYIFYDYSFEKGYGIIKPWPLPQANIYALHVFFKDQLGQFTSLDQVVNLPLEYSACIHYNMIKRLRVGYQLPPDMEVSLLASESIDILEGTNFQIPAMQMPFDLMRPGIYDPYSDQVY